MPAFGIAQKRSAPRTAVARGRGQRFEGRRVVLWDAARKVHGRHLPTLRQEEGSCVEQGKINAMMYLMCVERLRGDREKLEYPNLCHGYGWTRYYSGFSNRGHGALGSGAAKAATTAGVCPVGGYELPEPKIIERSGHREMGWGAANETKYSTYQAIPDPANQMAKKHLVRTTAPVTSYEQTRDAIVNGYPVTVASMQGFRMQTVRELGKHWGVPSGTWAHQMCFVGVDDDALRPGCYCLNSWGVDAHGAPADDAPPGGFWVDANIVDRMVRQQDSYAYSQFDGFPEQDLDFLLIG